MKHILLTAFLITTIFMPRLFAQVSYTANTQVPEYTGEFLYGTNPGYYNDFWNDTSKANIMRGHKTLGLNAKTQRPNLPNEFLDRYGYNIRINEFKHYQKIGMKDNTVFLGTYFDVTSTDPVHIAYIKKNMDSTKYGGCDKYPQTYKKLYEPIWDGGLNGTPVNENNPYALYIYKTVTTYKDYVKFWEIVNEPDFCGSSACEDAPGTPGNWWENPPKPCDLTNFRAPLYHYIRMLRISYEVIKTVSPDSYVALGGIGYRSFLDVLLRYTDNPDVGKVTAAFPLKGGAYFDVVSFHCYPQYNLRRYNPKAADEFDHFRFSDAVADSVISFKNNYLKILGKYGYNGITFPKKHFIMTEFNIPRKQYAGSNNIGSPDAQKNSIIKMFIKSQKEDIKQVYTYQLGDVRDENDLISNDWHHLMGAFKNLTTNKPGQQQLTVGGIAFKTTATLLEGYRYDKGRTTALALPTGVEGAAFKNAAGKYRYVLWARTATDLSEYASKSYTFPALLSLANVISYDWNYSVDATKMATRPVTSIPLTGSPIFFDEGSLLALNDEQEATPTPQFHVFPNPNQGKFSLSVMNLSGTGTVRIYSVSGTELTSYPADLAYGTIIENQFSLEKGVYFIHLLSSNRLDVQKVIIE